MKIETKEIENNFRSETKRNAYQIGKHRTSADLLCFTKKHDKLREGFSDKKEKVQNKFERVYFFFFFHFYPTANTRNRKKGTERKSFSDVIRRCVFNLQSIYVNEIYREKL